MSDATSGEMTSPGPGAPEASDLETEESGLIARYDGLSFRVKASIFIIAVAAIASMLAIWHGVYFHWFEVHSGTINETGVYSAFWSGFGSDLGEATIFVGIVATWRHHSGHVRGCARIGRPVAGRRTSRARNTTLNMRATSAACPLDEINGAHRRSAGPTWHSALDA